MELASHENDSAFNRRVSTIRSLPFIAFPKDRADEWVGGPLEMREREIAERIGNPALSLEQIVIAVRPSVTNGFCSGSEFCDRFEEQWSFCRQTFCRANTRQNAEVASVSHFAVPGFGWDAQIPLPDEELTLRSKEEIESFLSQHSVWLSQRIMSHGDFRLREGDPCNAEQIASKFRNEILNEGAALHAMAGNPLVNLLKLNGVELDRLPSRPTHADVGYEAIFVAQHRVFERRLGLPAGSLQHALRQEQLPFWIVWREIDRQTKRLDRAEGSSITDKMLLSFGLYIDAVEVDKRVYHCVSRAAKHCSLMKEIEPKVFKAGSLESLSLKLEELAQ